MRWPTYDHDSERNPEKPYRLLADIVTHTSIIGLRVDTRFYTLFKDGRLLIRIGYEWDGGTGAIDDKAMVAASLSHDVICEMTNSDMIPYKWRKHGDWLLVNQLRVFTDSWLLRQWRWARWLVVRVNSEVNRWVLKNKQKGNTG
mgnify:CR=1 FL=1|jgi:hypothetical protein|tara:strand:- start:717 stop:1148 length:432 start_codon:yes stop_codon:yes gene_type:complete